MIIANVIGAVEAARQQHSELAWYGFGKAPKSPIPFEMHRAAMTETWPVEQFLRAVEWLAQAKQIASVTRRRTSYDWKHVAERWHVRKGPGDYYIAEGMFIAAAVHLSFQIRRLRSSTSVWLNIATACDDRR